MNISPSRRTLPARSSFFARACFAALLLMLAGVSLAQSSSRDSYLAIQRQVEAIEPRLVKSTVVIRSYDGSGSGVIISPDGLVLTAAHVVEGRVGRNVTAVLSDGRTFPAAVIAADSDSDLGILKISGGADLPTAPLGDSSMLIRGEWILATGHPLGQHPGRPPVLRIGRVLGVMGGRGSVESRRISTDAPIISGDSGGPLFDLNGRVVGINSMVTSGGRLMSIHVPVNLSKTAVAEVQKGDKPDAWDGPSAAFSHALHDSQAALLAGDPASAVKYAKEARDADPTSAAARITLVRAYARTGQTNLALAALDEACERGFNDTDALVQDPDFAPLAHETRFVATVKRLQALNGIPGRRKGDRALLEGTVIPNANRGVVSVQAGGKEVALGAILSAEGDILTKASELPDGPLTCVLPDGQTVSAARGGVDAAWDVALLKIHASGLQTLPFAESANVGEWTFSPDASGAPAAVGIIGVAEMPVKDRGMAAKQTSKAYMGVQLQPLARDEMRDLGLTNGVRVGVQPDMPAARAGLQNGDIILAVDTKPVQDPDGLMDLLVNKKPGDSVSLRVAREKDRLTIVVPLTNRPARLPGRGGVPEMLSGDISRMQGPFPRVIHHDSMLAPNAMGGPLLDAEGRCLGLNIARADRTSTYAIEARDLKDIYARLKASR